MSKIGIIADAHLFGRWSQPQLYKKAIQDLQNKHKVDIIVDCGDLTDNSIINSVQSSILYDIFSNVKIPMHIVRGNHDSLSGTSLASVLRINSNIIVHDSIEVSDGMLFIPYTNSKTELKEGLSNLSLSESVKLAFSHLTMTENPYAMLTFNNNEASKLIHKYAEIVFNGHIHNNSECKTVYGTIFNVGSFSNQSFGDEDVPHYSIFSDGRLEQYVVDGSIMHKTVTINNIEDVDTLISLPNHNELMFNWRIKLPADFDFEVRNQIRSKLYDYRYTNNVQFDYAVQKKKAAESLKLEKESKTSKLPLLDQLFLSFEQTGQILNPEIKQELKEFK